MMFRYFVALVLPESAKDHLLSAQPLSVPGMRVLARQELHLTLHFLGELHVSSLNTVRSTLATLEVEAFDITIKGLGTFTAKGRPNVVWARVESTPRLVGLHRSIGAALTEVVDFQPEARVYSPHVTLARLDDSVSLSVIEDLLEKNKRLDIPAIPINEFALYSSEFVDGIPQYRLVALFHLL